MRMVSAIKEINVLYERKTERNNKILLVQREIQIFLPALMFKEIPCQYDELNETLRGSSYQIICISKQILDSRYL